MRILKLFGTSGRKSWRPQKREIQPRRIQPPILGPLIGEQGYLAILLLVAHKNEGGACGTPPPERVSTLGGQFFGGASSFPRHRLIQVGDIRAASADLGPSGAKELSQNDHEGTPPPPKEITPKQNHCPLFVLSRSAES